MKNETLIYLESLKNTVRELSGNGYIHPSTFVSIPRRYKSIVWRLALKDGVIERTGQKNILGQDFYRIGEKFLFSNSKVEVGS